MKMEMSDTPGGNKIIPGYIHSFGFYTISYYSLQFLNSRKSAKLRNRNPKVDRWNNELVILNCGPIAFELW